jgi:hypothetical protein
MFFARGEFCALYADFYHREYDHRVYDHHVYDQCAFCRREYGRLGFYRRDCRVRRVYSFRVRLERQRWI